jgi:indole-3-glycerol phosphate synthase
MVATYLDEILAHHRARANADVRSWRDRLPAIHYEGPSMLESLANEMNDCVKVIAEVKRRSPSKGWLNENLDVAGLADAYAKGGATAISVLTDTEHFSGAVEDLTTVASSVALPLLRKDFTVSENDVLDAAEMGASAVLLIAAALDDRELAGFLQLSHQVGIDALVEVHDHDEAARALEAGARIIGVNQRDLRTFDVDRDRASSVIDMVPSSIITVCESGLRTSDDVARAADAGFDAVLVGETFVTSASVVDTVREFSSVPLVSRG